MRLSRRLKNQISVFGNLEVRVHDAATGKLLSVQRVSNLVVTAGLSLTAIRLAGTAQAAITHFALGTSSTAVSAGQTALVAEVTREVVTQLITSTPAELQVKYYLGTTVGNGNTLREAGLFNAGASGTMFARALLSAAIVKTSAVTATFTWTITLTAV